MSMGLILSLATAVGVLAACGDAPDAPHSPTNPPVTITEPKTLIAFVSTRDGAPHLYVMNDDGTGVRRLTSGTEVEWAPAWSRDGGRIAFNSGPAGDTYVVNADGSDLTRLPASGGWPSWSPDGTRIVVAAWATPDDERPRFPGLSLRIIAVDGSSVTEVPLPAMIGTDTVYWAMRPRWSPDGQRILVEVSRMWYGDPTTSIQSLLMMNVDGTGTRLSLDGCSAAWSPDGTQLALWLWPAVGVTSVNTIYPTPLLMDTDVHTTSCDGGSADLFDSGVWPSNVADWSPHGRYLVATRWTLGKGLRLWMVDVQTGAAHHLTTGSSGQDLDAAWSRAVPPQ